MKILTFLLALVISLTSYSAAAKDYQVPVCEENEAMQTGRFEPVWESLASYEVPEWFRNAKFGIWAHWGPQCVEGSGDWMARSMYIEGSREYKHHLKNYGHPSEVGFKDILPMFKAEKWNPEQLVAFYKKIGARYFFALGNHHDNFDLWDSKYQEWNSVNIGPHKDILALWADAARKNGLPFGVSLHADHAWSWYEPAQRYDRSGDKMAVPYDGCLTKADGKGKWWEGYDPQKLYAQNHPMSKGSWADNMIHRQWAWGDGVEIPSTEFVTNFYNRTLDVVNRYDPDLLYFDVTGVPFYPISDAGLRIAAHFYNHNESRRNNNMSAVMFGKILDDAQREALVWDVERGAPNHIYDKPWQTCSCIGGWHYDSRFPEKGWYKSASDIVKLLVDVVSKNGNLLLSVPLRSDGTFDEQEEAILNKFGEWMNTNSEAIYDTRPWKIFGEGPIAESDIRLNAQGFNEGSYTKATHSEIRFTQKGKYLYATALAWPEDKQIVIKSLGIGKKLFTNRIKKVELLGYGCVRYSRTDKGLVIFLPENRINDIAPVIKIQSDRAIM